MKMNIYFCLALFLLCTDFVAAQACSSSQSHTACISIPGCNWTASDRVCQPAVDCSQQTQISCTSSFLSTFCAWNTATIGSCVVKPSACYIVNGTCNDPTICILNGANSDICVTALSDFGCSRISDEIICVTSPQCQWQTSSYCQSTENCEALPIASCDASNCTTIISAYKFKDTASATCSNILVQQQCLAIGCSFDYINSVCTIPDKCTIVNNESGQPELCTPSIGYCQTNTSTCSATSESSCSSPYCSWKTNIKTTCSDNTSYCSTNCSNKTPYCKLTASVNPTCTPKTLNTSCSSLTQSNCQTDKCTFIAETEDSCASTITSCSTFTDQNLCQQQKGCSFNQNYQCTAITLFTTQYAFNLIVNFLMTVFFILT